MRRRDLDLIADTIRTLPLADERRETVALFFADSLAAQVRCFDRWKFLQRCGSLKAEAMGDLPIMVADQTPIDAEISIKLIKRIPLSQGGKCKPRKDT